MAREERPAANCITVENGWWHLTNNLLNMSSAINLKSNIPAKKLEAK